MSKKPAVIVGISIVALFFASPVSANHRQDVLGDSTVAQTPTLPASSDGPGLILPDSPLFFLDTFKQNIKLFLAFTPEQKASVHAEIAGERLAEVRFELAKNNTEAAQIALEGVGDNLQKSSEELAKARLQGRDVTKLAQELNENMKTKRDMLTVLHKTSDGELKARVNVVQQSLLESKVTVEDSLPSDQLQQEIDDDLNHQIENEIEDASHSARGLEHAIDVLERNASDAAEKNQSKRQEALQRAIETKNEALKKQQERALEIDKKKLEISKEERAVAREMVKKAQEAAKKYSELKKKNEETSITSDTTTTEQIQQLGVLTRITQARESPRVLHQVAKIHLEYNINLATLRLTSI